MTWYTLNKCKVSLQCEFSYDSSKWWTLRMPWNTLNIWRVSHPCEFWNVSPVHLNLEMTWNIEYNCRASHYREFYYDPWAGPKKRRIRYIPSIYEVYRLFPLWSVRMRYWYKKYLLYRDCRSLQSELAYVSLGCWLLWMTRYILNNWLVWILYELSNAMQGILLFQMIWYTVNKSILYQNWPHHSWKI